MATLAIASTDPVPREERLALWGEMVWQLLGRLRSTTEGDETFRGHLEYGDLGDLRLCRLAASRHRVMRTPQLIRLDDRGYYKMVIQVRGCATFEQDGRRVQLSPGEWSIYDTMRAYSVSNDKAVEQMVLLLPRECIATGEFDPAPLMVRRYSATRGVGRLACQLIDATFQELPNCGGDGGRGVADSIAALMRLALLEGSGRAGDLALAEGLRDRIKRHVAANLRDPGLSIERIATACGCSKRSVHMVFRDEGMTISDYIWRQRLARCRADLDNPALRGESITAIALAWGFNSPTHFSRAFRECYGVPPSHYRDAGLGGLMVEAEAAAQPYRQ